MTLTTARPVQGGHVIGDELCVRDVRGLAAPQTRMWTSFVGSRLRDCDACDGCKEVKAWPVRGWLGSASGPLASRSVWYRRSPLSSCLPLFAGSAPARLVASTVVHHSDCHSSATAMWVFDRWLQLRTANQPMYRWTDAIAAAPRPHPAATRFYEPALSVASREYPRTIGSDTPPTTGLATRPGQ